MKSIYRLSQILCISYFILIVLGCQPEKLTENAIEGNNNPDTIVVNTAMQGLELTSISQQIRLVQLESLEESLFGRIDKLLVSDSIVAIVDKLYSKAVFVFDWNGNFLYKIFQIGDGPGEYVDIFDIDISGGHLYLSDRGRKIIRYNKYTGRFDKEYSFENWTGTEFVVLHNEDKAFFCRNFGHNDEIEAQLGKCLIFSSSLSGNNNNCIFKYEEYFASETYSPNIIFPRNGNDILISPSYTYQIYKYENKYAEPYLYLDFGDHAFNKNQLKAEYKLTSSVFEYLTENNLIHHLLQCTFSKNFLFASYKMARTSYNIVIDLKNNQVIMGGNPFISSPKYGFTLMMPRSSYEDWFVSVIETDQILNNYAMDPRFQELLNNNSIIEIHENDNPMLVFFTLNSNMQ